MVFLMTSASFAGSGVDVSQGQKVYVPVYSHIYAGPKNRPLNLTATLSIRNTDPDHWISVSKVHYYGSDGKLLKNYVMEPVKLTPLAATRYIIEENDTSGGSGASFVVTWTSEREVSVPIVEAVMITTKSQQGVSFVTRGKAIRELSSRPSGETRPVRGEKP